MVDMGSSKSVAQACSMAAARLHLLANHRGKGTNLSPENRDDLALAACVLELWAILEVTGIYPKRDVLGAWHAEFSSSTILSADEINAIGERLFLAFAGSALSVMRRARDAVAQVTPALDPWLA